MSRGTHESYCSYVQATPPPFVLCNDPGLSYSTSRSPLSESGEDIMYTHAKSPPFLFWKSNRNIYNYGLVLIESKPFQLPVS